MLYRDIIIVEGEVMICKTVFGLTISLLALSTASADTFILKNGTEYKGAILKENRQEVAAITDIGIIRFLKSDVKKIKKGSIWENNAYLKKAGQYVSGPVVATPQSGSVVTSPLSEGSSTDYALRQREMELREQELELKRTEIELLKEELKLKREKGSLEPRRARLDTVIGSAAPRSEEFEPITENAISEIPFPSDQPVPVDEEAEEERLRDIALEEQRKEQGRKDRLETYRRIQETRQKQEGITIRGKINPAGNENYKTY